MTLAAAVARAQNAGDEVILADDEYPLTAQITINRDITVRGTTRDGTIVKRSGSDKIRLFELNAAGAVLSTMTVSGGYDVDGANVLINTGGGTVTNCVIAFNTRAGAAETGTDWCLVDPNNTSVLVPSAYVNSCAWPAATGAFLEANGCVNADPRFTDAAHGDFTLRVSSPCRDAGATESWMAASRDLGGNQRVIGKSVDIGCYESAPRGLVLLFW